MPINFESTFTQPILAELDAGKIKSASDWAKVVTKYYVATIKTGLPSGVAVTLPAPSLSGAPYPIGNTFYNTIDAKSRVMENIIKAYFLVEEIKVQKAGIRGLTQTIKQLVIKSKILKSQIKSTTQQIKQVSKELKDLPVTLNELYSSISQEIKDKVKETGDLIKAIDDFGIQSNNTPVIRTLFADELRLIQDIQTFEFKFDTATLQKIAVLLSATDVRVSEINLRTSSSSAFKAYITQRITVLVKSLYELTNTAVYPTQYIAYYRDLSYTNSRAKLIYEKLKRIEFFEKKLQPTLKKLEEDLDSKRRQLTDRVELKIEDLKKDLSKRLEDLAARQGEGKITSFKKAKKTLTEYRKKYKDEVKNKQALIKKYSNIARSLTAIITKSTAILLGVVREINLIEQQATDVQLDIDREKQLISQFVTQNNLTEIANILTLLVVNGNITTQTIKQYMQRDSAVAARYYNELMVLINTDLATLLSEIYGTPKQQKAVAQQQTTTFLTFYNLYETKFKPQLNKINEYLTDKTRDVKKSIEEKLDSSKKDIKDFAINLIPVKSDVEDKKTKKLTVEEKLRLLKDKREKLSRVRQYLVCSKQVIQGSTMLVKNISNNQFGYSKNEQAITKIADGYFNFKSIAKTDSQIEGILQKKQQFKERTQDLSIVEGLMLGISSLVSEIKSDPGFIQTWKVGVLDNIKDNTRLATLQALGDVLVSGITIKDANMLVNKLTYSVIQDRNTIQNIAAIEQRYTLKAVQLFNRLGESNTRAGAYFKNLTSKLQGTNSIIIYLLNEVSSNQNKILTYLDKFIEDAKSEIENLINEKKEKIISDNKQALDKLKEKSFNVKAGVMSLTFSLATRALWSGATWIGPTGTVFTAISVGPFKPIKAKSTDGASAMVREMARGFETQLKILTGVYSNPGVGITPIPFIGYS